MMYLHRISLLSLRRSLGGTGFLIFLLILLLLGVGLANAADNPDDAELDAKLGERVLYVPVNNLPQVNLQVTLMKPDGPGPFPLAVLNHGKELGLTRNEKRYRSAYAARYFLSRGYAVILPMMRGFACSGGETYLSGCDIENMGLSQARDIGKVIQYMTTQSDLDVRIDPNRMVVSGQSVGGFDTLAVGTLNIPGVKALVNFAGGISVRCPEWQRKLITAVGHYGGQIRVPSIWFYGDNDAAFSIPIWRGMFDKYTAAGGQVELVAYGSFMKNSHNFLGQIEALPIWVPKLDAFLERVGLPNENLHPELLPAPYPKPTQFAAIDDLKAIPLINDKGRQSYKEEFLKKNMPRVFTIATNGSSISTDGGYDPLERAQGICKEHNFNCRVYAVDDQVVWPKPLPVPPATKFARLEDLEAVPYLGATNRQGYQRFLTLPKPRAFVIAPDGAWALSSRDFDVLASALRSCEEKHKDCKPYAVDDQVVWPESHSPVAQK